MDGETLIQIGTLLTVVIGLFGILIGIKKHNEQTTALILIEYAKRYEIIMASLPQEVQEVFYSRGTDFKTTEKVDRNVLEYFKLCSEEYFFFKNRYLSKKVWVIWEKELKVALESEFLQHRWDEHYGKIFEKTYPSFYNKVISLTK